LSDKILSEKFVGSYAFKDQRIKYEVRFFYDSEAINYIIVEELS